MAYVIAEPCVGAKDTACVDACPVDAIHPKNGRTGGVAAPQLYIQAEENQSVVNKYPFEVLCLALLKTGRALNLHKDPLGQLEEFLGKNAPFLSDAPL
jgi:NAD-dependent dihydropyrimidine dehydrogenase PreA subunit